MSVFPEELKTRPTSPTLRQTAEKICTFLLPFLLLLVYIAVSAGIYYAVEKECDITLMCPATYVVLDDSEGVLSKEQESTSENGASSAIRTTTVTVKTNETIYRNNSILESWENLTYWTAFHFIAISVTTIGKMIYKKQFRSNKINEINARYFLLRLQRSNCLDRRNNQSRQP